MEGLLILGFIALYLLLRPVHVPMAPEAFLALLDQLPRPTIVDASSDAWNGDRMYSYRNATHVISTRSPTELNLPPHVIRLQAPRRAWWVWQEG